MVAFSEARGLVPLRDEDAMRGPQLCPVGSSFSCQMCSDPLLSLHSPSPNSKSCIALDGDGRVKQKGKDRQKEAERRICARRKVEKLPLLSLSQYKTLEFNTHLTLSGISELGKV